MFPDGIEWSLTYTTPLDYYNKDFKPYSLSYRYAPNRVIRTPWDTSNVTNMNDMFYNCGSLSSLDLSHFNTSNVTNMRSMVSNCSNLTSIDLNGWDTSNVTDMYNMLYYCGGLRYVDLSGWDTSNVTNMSYMFGACSSLTSLDLSHFNTSNVTNMSYMFQDCYGLKSLDISNFDFSKVTSISGFIYASGNRLVDLRFGKNLKINWTSSGSPNSQSNLSKESLLSIIDGLYDFVGNGETTTRSCQFGSTNLAKLTDEEKALATNKGWTLT